MSAQTRAVRSSAGAGTSTPSAPSTQIVPYWLVTTPRPSGVKARAVGAGTDATTPPENPTGRVAAAAGAAGDPVWTRI